MKLSKNELNVLLNAQMEWHLDNAEFLRSQGFSGKKNDDLYERYEALLNELEDGSLEIEGYEQSKWTRFDPKDESTYPPKGKFLAYGGFECEPQGIFLGLSYDNKSTRIAYGKVLKYWRPLPKPPQETEGKDCK